MRRILAFVAIFWGFQVESAPIRVLILSGQNNHKWKETTPALSEILEEDGLSVVRITESPETLSAEALSEVDVIVSNWNSFGKSEGVEPVLDWPETTRKAYVNFVMNGGGHVVVHAGSASFYDWEDYHRICNATWKDETGHGAIHRFKVRMTEREHPITAGLDNFETTDELWYRPSVEQGASVLAESFSKTTDNWEPTVLTSRFGKGRCVTLLLGHNAKSMQSPGFRILLKRGIKWVEPGKKET